jgi:hypothetical protein
MRILPDCDSTRTFVEQQDHLNLNYISFSFTWRILRDRLGRYRSGSNRAVRIFSCPAMSQSVKLDQRDIQRQWWTCAAGKVLQLLPHY